MSHHLGPLMALLSGFHVNLRNLKNFEAPHGQWGIRSKGGNGNDRGVGIWVTLVGYNLVGRTRKLDYVVNTIC